ncbi:MAG: pyridoxal-phosphate dependent enzyme, partial [Gammaproteobacteria bacterium]|nr:pyridoxal-phosphate dependent enzyme [Gammaproteobacteria bacterium]
GTTLTAAPGFAAAAAAAERIRQAHPGGADRLYVIPWGGSSPIGSAGFVAAGLELAAQLRAAGISARPRIYLPCGTMGSVAGLLLGLRLARCPATVVAVKVVPQAPVNAAAVAELCQATLTHLHARDPAFPARLDGPAVLEFREGYLGDGYGVATPAGLAAAALARDLAGLRLEATYAAKALACLFDDARAQRAPGDVPVFWLTCNGQPYPAGLDEAPVGRLPPALRRYLDPALT